MTVTLVTPPSLTLEPNSAQYFNLITTRMNAMAQTGGQVTDLNVTFTMTGVATGAEFDALNTLVAKVEELIQEVNDMKTAAGNS